jgi:uncharacterized protein YdeI (YjbR/CyaY-like superfamily)
VPRLPIMRFKSSSDYRSWLAKNHARSDGLWLRIYKKGAGGASVTYAEALDQSLCYGWIDGQKKPCDERSWLQKFTPRRPKGGWSKINTQHAERLIKSGEMAPAGLKAIEAAKADGRWKTACDSPGNATPPEDFLRELSNDHRARALFRDVEQKKHLCHRV